MVSSMPSVGTLDSLSRSDQYKKVMKPLLERKRRARINKCLDELRELLVTVLHPEGESVTRLEKADILELTVRHVKELSDKNRLNLPPPSVIQQQEEEDTLKFSQGFAAAAQQVQSFLLATNLLEPTVRSQLFSHLSNCVTSINKSHRHPPPLVRPQPTSPSLTPPGLHAPCQPPVSPNCLPSPTTVSGTSSAPPRASCVSAAPTTTTSTTFAIPAPVRPVHNRPSAPAAASVHASTPAFTYQGLPPKPPRSSAPHPLIDLSNRQMHVKVEAVSCPQPTPSITVRDIEAQERVAPSPFIDVVSTENDEPEPLAKGAQKIPEFFENAKKMWYESFTRSRPPAAFTYSKPFDFSGNKQIVDTSLNTNRKGIKRSLSDDERDSASPEDLSMKRFKDDGSSRWRPW